MVCFRWLIVKQIQQSNFPVITNFIKYVIDSVEAGQLYERRCNFYATVWWFLLWRKFLSQFESKLRNTIYKTIIQIIINIYLNLKICIIAYISKK